MRTRSSRRATTLLLCALLGGASAWAQTLSDGDRAARADLMRRAQEAVRAGQLDDALGLVRRAEQIGTTAGTALLGARIHAAAGRPAAALQGAERCLRDVDLDSQTTPANRLALRTACEALRNEVSPRTAALQVNVPPGAPAGLVVRINGEIVPPANYGASRTVDPGTFRVVATVPGRPPWERMESVAASAHAAIDVVIPAAPAAPPARPVTPPPAENPPDDRSPLTIGAPPPGDTPAPSGSTQRTLGFVSGAVGLGLLASGVVGSLLFLDTESQYTNARCPQLPRDHVGCNDQFSSLETFNTVQWIGYVGGGALVATGAILLLTAPSRRPAAPPVQVALGADGASLLYRGSF